MRRWLILWTVMTMGVAVRAEGAAASRGRSAARATSPVRVARDRRGRVTNRREVEAAARNLMRRAPTSPHEKRATWKQLVELADGTRFRKDVIRAAFRLTTRREYGEFGMHFTRSRLPNDVFQAIYGYKPMSRPLKASAAMSEYGIASFCVVFFGIRRTEESASVFPVRRSKM